MSRGSDVRDRGSGASGGLLEEVFEGAANESRHRDFTNGSAGGRTLGRVGSADASWGTLGALGRTLRGGCKKRDTGTLRRFLFACFASPDYPFFQPNGLRGHPCLTSHCFSSTHLRRISCLLFQSRWHRSCHSNLLKRKCTNTKSNQLTAHPHIFRSSCCPTLTVSGQQEEWKMTGWGVSSFSCIRTRPLQRGGGATPMPT